MVEIVEEGKANAEAALESMLAGKVRMIAPDNISFKIQKDGPGKFYTEYEEEVDLSSLPEVAVEMVIENTLGLMRKLTEGLDVGIEVVAEKGSRWPEEKRVKFHVALRADTAATLGAMLAEIFQFFLVHGDRLEALIAGIKALNIVVSVSTGTANVTEVINKLRAEGKPREPA